MNSLKIEFCDNNLLSNENKKFCVNDGSSKISVEDEKSFSNRKISVEDEKSFSNRKISSENLEAIIENESGIKNQRKTVIVFEKLSDTNKVTESQKSVRIQNVSAKSDIIIPAESILVEKKELKSPKKSVSQIVSARQKLSEEAKSFVETEMLLRSKIMSGNQEMPCKNIKELNIQKVFNENENCSLVFPKMLSKTIEALATNEFLAKNKKIVANKQNILSNVGKKSEECKKVLNKFKKLPVKIQNRRKMEKIVEVRRRLAKKQRWVVRLETQNQSIKLTTESESRSIVKEEKIVKTKMLGCNQIKSTVKNSDSPKNEENRRNLFKNKKKSVEKMQLKNQETTLGSKFDLKKEEMTRIQGIKKTCPTIYDVLHLIITLNTATCKKKHHLCDVIEKLVKQEKLNFVVLNLYRLKDGFTVFAKAEKETFLCKMSYENMSFLEEIDRGEIPMKLLWMLKGLKEEFMYDRFFIIQINDFVTKSSLVGKKISPCFSFFKLLRLSYEVLKRMVEEGTVDRIRNIKAVIEKNIAALLIEFADPLCLDPTPVSLVEQFQIKNNSFSRPEFQEVLQKKLHLTQAQSKNLRCSSGFSSFIKKMKNLNLESADSLLPDFETSLLSYDDSCLDKQCSKISVECEPSFEAYLNNRQLKIVPRSKYKSLVLIEEFEFHCLRVDGDGKEVIHSDWLSIFQTAQTEMFYVKIFYSTHSKSTKPKQDCFKLSSISELNKCILRHIKVLTNGWTHKYKVVHKIASSVPFVVVNNIPAEFKIPPEYRETGDPTDIIELTMTEASMEPSPKLQEE